MSKTYSQCQSCAMPLQNGKAAGTEKDGSKSDRFCHYCYQDGGFCDPQMPLSDMKEIVENALKERGWWWPLRQMALWQLPTLERWKK